MSVPTLTPRAAREQSAFRSLLNAMARPGSIARVGAEEYQESEAALSILEALLDHEVTFAVVPERPETVEAILRQTGSHNASLAGADYILTDGDSLPHVLREAKIGDLEYPDRSATVVCVVLDIGAEAGHGRSLMLMGPGIKDSRLLLVDGIGTEAVEALQATNSMPPQGIELIFVTPDGRFACITRYTRLKEAS